MCWLNLLNKMKQCVNTGIVVTQMRKEIKHLEATIAMVFIIEMGSKHLHT